MMFPHSLRILPSLLLIASLHAQPAKRGCGTMQAVQRMQGQAQAKGSSARIQPPPDLRGRKLLTSHFALHYTVAPNVHRIKWTPADSALRFLADSILQSLPASLPVTERDSALHAVLDLRGAPHPAYVLRAAQYCETARAHFVDTLGMLAPDFSAGTGVFNAPLDAGKFRIDIADIGNADTFYQGEYYALTYPPSEVSILLENDFLWNARMDLSGNVTGSPVHAEMSGQVLHYYDQEWDLGLKVTLMHEVYHAIQFAHTPALFPYHAWYEISAVGMEERLAPEVDDYFQYLPCVMNNHANMSLFSIGGPCSHSPVYGQGIFHLYLTRVLGRTFDAAVWSTLGTNGNDLPKALLAAAGSQSNWDNLYSNYAAALAGAGRPEAASTAFTPDLPRWPKPSADSMPPPASVILPMPSLSFRLLSMQGAGNTGRLWGFVGANPWNNLKRIDQNGTELQTVPLPGNQFPLAAGAGNSTLYFVLPNTSFDKLTQVALAPYNGGATVFPNPASLADSPPVLFSVPAGTAPNSQLTVVSASGRRVADLTLLPGADFWTWDLRNGGIPVSPGVYYYRTAMSAPQTFLVLPR